MFDVVVRIGNNDHVKTKYIKKVYIMTITEINQQFEELNNKLAQWVNENYGDIEELDVDILCELINLLKLCDIVNPNPPHNINTQMGIIEYSIGRIPL